MTTTDTTSHAPTAGARGRFRPGPRTVVGALWLFAILNYLYCDVLGLFDPVVLREILDGTAAVEMSEPMLLGAAVLMTVPIVNVLLARIAPHGLARWASIVGASIMTLVQAATLFVGTTTSYYLYFSVIEIATTATIVWIAARRWGVDR